MTCRIDRLATEGDGVILRVSGRCVGGALDVLRDALAEGHGVRTIDLGSSHTIRVDVRLIAATNQQLGDLVEARRFRMDLYYRLSVFPITLPPLRERTGDIPLLVRHFVRIYAARHHKSVERVPDDAMAALVAYDWPGNIRQLQNFIERSVILTKGRELHAPVAELVSQQNAIPGSRTLADADRAHIISVLRETNWTVGGRAGAAARLGVLRTTLIAKMKKLGISREAADGLTVRGLNVA